MEKISLQGVCSCGIKGHSVVLCSQVSPAVGVQHDGIFAVGVCFEEGDTCSGDAINNGGVGTTMGSTHLNEIAGTGLGKQFSQGLSILVGNPAYFGHTGSGIEQVVIALRATRLNLEANVEHILGIALALFTGAITGKLGTDFHNRTIIVGTSTVGNLVKTGLNGFLRCVHGRESLKFKLLGIGFIARPDLDIGTVVCNAAICIQIVAQSRTNVEITATGILQIPLLCVGAVALVLLHILAAFGFAVSHIQCLAGLRIDDCVPATIVISRSKDLGTTAVTGPKLDIGTVVVACTIYIHDHVVVQTADNDVFAIGDGLRFSWGVTAHSQLVADTRHLVISARRDRINGGIVDLSGNGMIAKHDTRIIFADTAVGSNSRSGAHAVSGVTRRTGVGADIDGYQTQNVIGSEPTRAIARAAGAGRITYADSLAVGGDLSDDDLILEAVDIVAGSFVGKRVVSEAVDLGCARQGHSIGHEGKPIGYGVGHRRRGGGGCFDAEERDSPEAQHQGKKQGDDSFHCFFLQSV